MDDNGLPLRVRDLKVTGELGRPILQVDNLDLAPGQALGVTGASGAGKSTLLLALAGLIESASGQISWGSHDLLSMRTARLSAFRSRFIGLIFQNFLLFDELDATANASLQALFVPKAKRSQIRDRAGQLLADFGIDHGNRTVDSFSGGERQRVAVARALAHDPPIILADEPTANLQRPAADALTNDLLAEVSQRGRTLIVVSHDERLLSRIDHVLELSDGRPKQELKD